jgi:hypothetical protein
MEEASRGGKEGCIPLGVSRRGEGALRERRRPVIEPDKPEQTQTASRGEERAGGDNEVGVEL